MVPVVERMALLIKNSNVPLTGGFHASRVLEQSQVKSEDICLYCRVIIEEWSGLA